MKYLILSCLCVLTFQASTVGQPATRPNIIFNIVDDLGYHAENITPAEDQILKKGVSDGDFHYLGSGKIMVGIGRGFAEALAETIKKQGTTGLLMGK